MTKNTSISLGDHFTGFVNRQLEQGRYGSASEVVRDALRALEDQKTRLDALRAHLAEGAAQARQGRFVEDYSVDRLIAALDDEG